MIRRPPRSTRTHSFPTRRSSDLAKDWGISAKSSSTDRTIAAIQSFGLIEDSGSGENRKIKLSEDGARILADARPGLRACLLAEAALKSPAIAEYAQTWAEGRPDEIGRARVRTPVTNAHHLISLLQ